MAWHIGQLTQMASHWSPSGQVRGQGCPGAQCNKIGMCHSCQEGQKAGDPLKKVRKAVKQCENCGDDYDWMPSHSGWWAD